MTDLPRRVVLDTNVCVHAFLDRDPVAVETIGLLVEHRAQISIAAVSFAELLRKGGREDLPSESGIRVLPFDGLAAKQLAAHVPITALKLARDGSPFPLDYWKCDALIVACALRFGADCLLTRDDGMTKIAKVAGVRAADPEELLRWRQLRLPER